MTITWPSPEVEEAALAWCALLLTLPQDVSVLRHLASEAPDALVACIEDMLDSPSRPAHDPIAALLERMSERLCRQVEAPVVPFGPSPMTGAWRGVDVSRGFA